MAKNISYWEQWPGVTGHQPSLPVLGRLAEIYECSVSDLLADFCDHRHKDACSAYRHKEVGPAVTGRTGQTGRQVAAGSAAALPAPAGGEDEVERRTMLRIVGARR